MGLFRERHGHKRIHQRMVGKEKKMFSLDKFLTATTIEVNATDITFRDMRSGQTMKRTIYRPGGFVSYTRLGEEMARYGYQLINIGDPTDIRGRMNWSDVFGKFIQEEPVREEE